MSQLKHKVSFQTGNYLRSPIYIYIYKGKGSKDDAGNYRPISLIGHIMNIFEKEIKLQVMGYLEVTNLITSVQSAYRNQHNTQTALHTVVDDWLYNISDGNLTGVCSFDITKCFETINHAILLKKMSFYGFKDHASKWFQSYLYKREQNCIMSKSIIWKVSTSDRCSTRICLRAAFIHMLMILIGMCIYDLVISMLMIR